VAHTVHAHAYGDPQRLAAVPMTGIPRANAVLAWNTGVPLLELNAKVLPSQLWALSTPPALAVLFVAQPLWSFWQSRTITDPAEAL